jgi:hypothetical protein
MQAKPSLASVESLIDGIAHSRSAFEQFHALLLARTIWRTLMDDDRQKLLRAIESQIRPGGHIRPGTDRHDLVREIWREA